MGKIGRVQYPLD